MSSKPDYIMLIPRLRVQNANCISGPLSWGFPAVSSFTGFVHALSRNMNGKAGLDGAGIISHRFEPQVNNSSYTNTFRLYRAPVYDRDVTKPSGIIEEGRAHMTVSLVVCVYGRIEDTEAFCTEVLDCIGAMRLAGGSIFVDAERNKPQMFHYTGVAEEDEKIFRKLRRKLLPGFALIDRSSYLAAHLEKMREEMPESNALDALLDCSALKHKAKTNDNGKTEWNTFREGTGWLVPIPVGFSAISPLYEAGKVKNVRDMEVPFRFVESAYSLGEWINPLKLDDVSDFIWFHKAEPEKGYYLCGHKKI